MSRWALSTSARRSHSLPAWILRQGLDDFRLVSDRDLRRAILTLIETTRLVAEGAGAAALAGAIATEQPW